MSSPTQASAKQLAENAIKEVFSDIVSSGGPVPQEAAVGATEPVVPVTEPVVPVTEPVVPVDPLLALNKQEIKDAHRLIKLSGDETQEEREQIEAEQRLFAGILDRGGDNTEDLRKKLREVQAKAQQATSAVAARKLAKAEIEREFATVDLATIEQAPGTEKEPVKNLAAEIAALLKPADSHNKVDEMRDKLNQAQQQLAEVRESIEKRKKEKAEIEQQLAGLPWSAIEVALDGEKAPLETLRKDALKDLATDPLDNPSVARARAVGGDLARQVDDLAKKVEQRLIRKGEIEKAAAEVTLLPESASDSLDGPRNLLRDELKKPLSEAVLDEADKALEALRDAAEVVREKTEKLISRREMYRRQLEGAAAQIAKYIKHQTINTKIEAATGLLETKPVVGISTVNLDQFPLALKAVRRAAQTQVGNGGRVGAYIDAELDAVRKEMAAMASGLSSKQRSSLEDKIKDIAKSMSAKKLNPTKLGTNLKAVSDLRNNLESIRAEVGVALEEMSGQREFIQEQIDTADPDDVDPGFAKKLEDSREAIRQLLPDPLVQGKLDQAAKLTKPFYDLLAKAKQDVVNGKAVEQLLADIGARYGGIHAASRRPVQAELAAAWSADQALAARKGDDRDMKAARLALEKLVARLAEVEAENHKAVASKAEMKTAKAGGQAISEEDANAIYDEFGPDGIDGLKAGLGNLDEVAKLCQSFKAAKPGGVAALGALTRDGLGSPAALVSLFRDGCAGDAAKLQQFETTFGAAEDKANLRGMLDTALGKDAGLLNSALKTGCGLDTMPVSKRKDFATATGDLKTFCAAFKDEKDQRKLSGLLQKGGIGEHPAVFGNILKIGCEGDPKKGEDSMDYRAGQMKKLAAAYGNPTDQARLKGMMDNGGFGHQNCPQVLAHVLKTGCDGDPAKLKNLGNAFKTDEDLAKLDDLIMQGGFGGAPPDDRQDTLGKVLGQGLRYQDTPDKDEPQRLKNLHAAFAGNGGADLAQLKTVVDTFNDDLQDIYTSPPPAVAPREEPVPGERFANLLNKKNMNGNITKLKTMYDQLRAQSLLGGTVGINPPAPVVRRTKSLNELIRNASTIKKADLTGAAPAKLGQGACAQIKSADMSHFCDRHTREHTKFAELANKTIVTQELNSADQVTRKRGKRKAKKSSMWPEGITDKEIARFVDNALTALGASVPTNATFAGGSPVPPGAKLDGNFIQWDNLAIPSNPAFTITIGFEWKSAGNIAITQFYPNGGPGLEEIVFFDNHAIQEGIK